MKPAIVTVKPTLAGMEEPPVVMMINVSPGALQVPVREPMLLDPAPLIVGVTLESKNPKG